MLTPLQVCEQATQPADYAELDAKLREVDAKVKKTTKKKVVRPKKRKSGASDDAAFKPGQEDEDDDGGIQETPKKKQRKSAGKAQNSSRTENQTTAATAAAAEGTKDTRVNAQQTASQEPTVTPEIEAAPAHQPAANGIDAGTGAVDSVANLSSNDVEESSIRTSPDGQTQSLEPIYEEDSMLAASGDEEAPTTHTATMLEVRETHSRSRSPAGRVRGRSRGGTRDVVVEVTHRRDGRGRVVGGRLVVGGDDVVTAVPGTEGVPEMPTVGGGAVAAKKVDWEWPEDVF